MRCQNKNEPYKLTGNFIGTFAAIKSALKHAVATFQITSCANEQVVVANQIHVACCPTKIADRRRKLPQNLIEPPLFVLNALLTREVTGCIRPR